MWWQKNFLNEMKFMFFRMLKFQDFMLDFEQIIFLRNKIWNSLLQFYYLKFSQSKFFDQSPFFSGKKTFNHISYASRREKIPIWCGMYVMKKKMLTFIVLCYIFLKTLKKYFCNVKSCLVDRYIGDSHFLKDLKRWCLVIFITSINIYIKLWIHKLLPKNLKQFDLWGYFWILMQLHISFFVKHNAQYNCYFFKI